MALVIKRRLGQRVQIGESLVTVGRIAGNFVRLVIEAPPHIDVSRPDGRPLVPDAARERDDVPRGRVHPGTAQAIACLMRTEHYDACCRVIGFLSRFQPREYKHLMRSPVVAAMFATFAKAPQRAEEFWSAVATGVGLDSGDDPRLRLRNYTMTYSVGYGLRPVKQSRYFFEDTNTSKEAVSAEVYYRACVVCWNAWRGGRGLKVIRIPDGRPAVA